MNLLKGPEKTEKKTENSMEPIILPIEDVLDLHHFRPKDIPDLIRDYVAACREKGLYYVRIIHGKGAGILKSRVTALLKDHPDVVAFGDAPTESGGWGATLVQIRER
jgi:DNA-nicking Smr family endonuclease